MSCCLFIGNGFDLDLGMKTSYSDFYESRRKQFRVIKDSSLLRKLDERKDIDTWFDLEKCLFDYAIHHSIYKTSSVCSSADLEMFKQIQEQIGDYIHNERIKLKEPVRQMAYKVLELFGQSPSVERIFTFNYTQLDKLAYDLGLKIQKDKVVYLHGDVCEPILGIIDDEKRPIKSPYNQMIKSWHDNYNSHDTYRVMENCEEVVFFGLSFGFIDAVYFADFFKVINADKTRGAAKHITIFTKDDNSRMSILENFREIGIDSHQLFANTNLSFIKTSPEDSDPHNLDNFESLAQRLRS